MRMKDSSASALAWLAAILILAGLLIMSPSGALFMFVLAALVAAVPLLAGKNRIRIFAALLLILAVYLAFNNYPKYKEGHDRLLRRGMNSFLHMQQWESGEVVSSIKKLALI